MLLLGLMCWWCWSLPAYLVVENGAVLFFRLFLPRCRGMSCHDFFFFLRLAAVAQLGQASVDHIPRELRIMGRTILTQKGKTKWYDLPLTEQEIEHGGTVGEPPRRFCI